MSAPPGSQLQCSGCRGYGHNRRSCGRGPKKRIRTKEQSLHQCYRLELKDFEEMKARGCGLCGCDLSGRTPDVDHDHSCDHPGKGRFCCRQCVRGVLCRSCNLRVGAFERGLNNDADIGVYLGRERQAEQDPQLAMF